MAMILAGAALLRTATSAAQQAGRAIREAALEAVAEGVRTADLGGHAGTTEYTDEVIRRVRTKLEVWAALVEPQGAPRRRALRRRLRGRCRSDLHSSLAVEQRARRPEVDARLRERPDRTASRRSARAPRARRRWSERARYGRVEVIASNASARPIKRASIGIERAVEPRWVARARPSARGGRARSRCASSASGAPAITAHLPPGACDLVELGLRQRAAALRAALRDRELADVVQRGCPSRTADAGVLLATRASRRLRAPRPATRGA